MSIINTFENEILSVLQTVISYKSLKVKKSDIFSDDKIKLKTYITQCELYIEFNVAQYKTNQNKML